MPTVTQSWYKLVVKIVGKFPNESLPLYSCLNNYMPKNQFKRGELYSFITGKASTAISRRLQKNFKQAGVDITIEQWSVLYHLWKQDGLSPNQLQYKAMDLANQTLNEALEGVTNGQIEIAKEVLQKVYDNLANSGTL